METELNIIKTLDDLRIQRSLSIEEFTKGIVSKRNYSRYLNGEIKITVMILSKLLEKIQISLSDFSYYVQNVNIVNYGYEIDFFNKVVKKDYKNANALYDQKIKGKQLHTHLSEYAIHCAYIYLQYKLKHINLETARWEIKTTIDLDEILNRHIYTNDIIGGIYFYSLLGSKRELEKIKEFLIDFLIAEKRKNFSLQHEESVYLLHIMFLKILTSLDVTKENAHLIDIESTKALDFDRRARTGIYNIFILEILYHYANKVKLKNRDTYAFYYIAALLAYEDEEDLKNYKFEVKKSDFEWFLNQIQDGKMINIELYEGLINDDYL